MPPPSVPTYISASARSRASINLSIIKLFISDRAKPVTTTSAEEELRPAAGGIFPETTPLKP
jgi:hypothetical protein